jgi:type IV pilus assembly protein PilQ
MKRSWLLAAVAILMVAPRLPAGPGEAAAPGEVTAVSVLPGSGSALVVVDVSGAVSVQDFTLDNPARLVVDVVGATLRAPGVVYDGVNRGGILNIRYAQFRPDVVRIVLELESVKDYHLEYADDAIRVSLSSDRSFAAWSSGELPPTSIADDFASSSAPPLPEPSASQAFQSQQPRVTVTWDSASIADVMAGFAEFSGRSIVLGQDVDATVWAEISDQPWDVAFNEILEANGFEAVEDTQTGIIRVQNPAIVANRDSLEPRRTVVMPVNFKRADGIQAALQPVLQARGGTVVADQTTNQLIITDRQSRIPEDSMLVAQLDVPTAQVSIQAKLIFVDRTDIEELGVQYDIGNQDQFFNKLIQRPDPRTSEPVDTDGDGVPDAVFPTSSFEENDVIIDLGGNSLSAIGNAEAIIPSPALRLIFSTAIGNFNLSSFINALQQVELADLQAEPLISTTDNTQAEILVGERTPVRVIDAGSQQGQAGAAGVAPVATVDFQETGIRLEVTPHVTNAGQVLMQIHAENSSVAAAPADIGFTFQTQEATNEILVDDGETAVIGGLTVTQVSVSKSGIPFLVDLPIIGRIFGFTTRREERRDLLILVTPHIVDNPFASPGGQ